MFVRPASEIEFNNVRELFTPLNPHFMSLFSEMNMIVFDMAQDEPRNLLSYYPEEILDNTMAKHFLAAHANGFYSLVSKETDVQFGEVRANFVPQIFYKKKYHVPATRKIVVEDRPIGSDKPKISLAVDVDHSSYPTTTQQEILNNLPMNVDRLENNYHGKSVNTMIRNGWMTKSGDEYVITDAGAAAKTRVKVEGVDGRKARWADHEKAEKPLYSPKQIEALEMLAENSSNVEDLHPLTKKFMIENGWINRDGTFRSTGAAILNSLGFEMENNKIDDDVVVETLEKETKLFLTPVQRDLFSRASMERAMRGWTDLHGKTKNFVVKRGWFTENGKLTNEGLSIKNAM